MKDVFLRILSSDAHGTSDVSLIAFFVFFGLLAGIILREVQKKINIPYTPVLLVLGLLASLIGSNVTVLGEATALVAQIDPSGILLIFIPILIFESSFKADWHIFKRSMKKILLLAGPGLMFSFALTAVGMKVILQYNDDEMSWSAALMLGAIVAATDPVAIVALLKSIGAPHYFSTIVEGESLLNDGTGVVFFTIFANIASGKEISAGVGIGFFLFLCIGGVALGFLFSLLASSWLEKIFNDSILSISITITASYLLFWVAETFRASFTSEVKAGVSGILALCTLGFFLSAYGKTKIPVRVEHPLHAVIQWAQYVSETLIFLLTGIIVGKFLFHPEKTIGGSDWMGLIIFFIMINVIRAALITILSPYLKRGSYKMSFKELFILSYAGLRGALGLSLALTVHHDGSLPLRTRELVLFYVAGTAALTLLVNGTTTGLLVKKIKLIKEFPIKKKMFTTFMSEIERVTCNSYERLRVENPAAVCDWESVKKVLNIKTDTLAQNSLTDLNGATDGLEIQTLSEEEIRTEVRYKMLHIFKELIWKRYEDGEIEAYGANTLDKAVSISLDDLQDRINIFEFLYLYFVNPSSLKLFSKLLKIPLIGCYFKSLIVNQMVFIYDVSTSLVSIVDELKDEIEKMVFPEKIMKEVFAEFEADRKGAESYLHKLEGQFLDIITYITTKRYITKALIAQKKFITDRYNISAIETKEYNKLIHEIEKKIRNLPKALKVKWEPPTFSSLMLSFPVFNMLSEEQIKRIIANSRKVKFKEGQYLFQEGEIFDGIYLITKGELKINYQNYKSTQRGVGRLISFFNLVMFDNISRIDCQATQKVEAHKIDLSILREIMQESPKFEEKVYKGAFGNLRFMKPKEAKEVAKMSDIQAKSLAQSSELVYFTKGKTIKLPSGGFVIKGMLKRWENVYEEYFLVPKNSKPVIAQTDGIVLKFHTTEFGTKRKKSSPRGKGISDFNWEWDYPLLARRSSGSKTPNGVRRREANSEIIRPQPPGSIWSFEIDLEKED